MMLGFGGLTSTESKWSLLIMFPSITNIASVNIPATTCLKSTPISPFEQKTLSFPLSDPTYYKTHTHSLSHSATRKREKIRKVRDEEWTLVASVARKSSKALGSWDGKERDCVLKLN